uniref:Uncharacterized protein n=1 Tax=Moschus moschiferus TaxID=68415 RepID=A0A8C6FET6_MOSMO
MKLTDSMLWSFCVAKVFHENSDQINCFHFSPNGEMVVSSSNDDSMVLYDCQEGKPKRTLGHLRHLRCSMIGLVSGQGLSSAMMASSSSSLPMAASSI